jgi:hypothetical protein
MFTKRSVYQTIGDQTPPDQPTMSNTRTDQMAEHMDPALYINLMRALQVAVVVTEDGVCEVKARDIPSYLTLTTGGAFKSEWAEYVLDRVHIKFERLDEKRKFRIMDVMLKDPNKGPFLRFHMNMTSQVWTWHHH